MGVPVRGEPRPDTGVMGPLEMLRERRPLAMLPDIPRGLFELRMEPRRWGVEMDEVERDKEELVRRRGAGPGLSALGVTGVVGRVGS